MKASECKLIRSIDPSPWLVARKAGTLIYSTQKNSENCSVIHVTYEGHDQLKSKFNSQKVATNSHLWCICENF